MRTFQIFIDSCGELNAEMRKKYNIDYFPMMLNIAGKEVVASLDYDQGISFHEFYDLMRNGTRCFTSQVPSTTFEKRFEEFADKGENILYISCSSALSASFECGRKVASEFMKKHPEMKIVCVDALNSCYGEAMMAIEASKMRDEGKTLEEIESWLLENRLRFNQYATVDDLKYLKQAGRVKASAAFFGNIFSVHPILISDSKGNNLAVAKINGKKKALMYLAKAVVDCAEDIENQIIYVCHADDLKAAEFVRSEILRISKPKEVHIGYMGPIIGASTGPGTIGVYSFGKPIAKMLEEGSDK